MVFIASFVWLNSGLGSSETERIIRSFFILASSAAAWMVLSVADRHADTSIPGLILKSVFCFCMLNMSVMFLLFTYRLVNRSLDGIFATVLTVNTLAILARYLLPIDYSDPVFWRMDDPVLALAMSVIFSMPVVYAMILLVASCVKTNDERRKKQLKSIFAGAAIATVVSIISEYILPAFFDIDTSITLLYVALLIFVLFTGYAILKHRLLLVRSDYVFRKLFMDAHEGTLIVDKNARVISVNKQAMRILHTDSIDIGDPVSGYIDGYEYEADYRQHEIVKTTDGDTSYLLLTQYPIEPSDPGSAKILTITDITDTKRELLRENSELMKKTYIDQLTGLYNRMYLIDEDSPFYAGLRLRGSTSLALLFIDADNFKAINDTYGHLTGDAMLRELAACIRDNIRKDCYAVRFGGDEFIVVLSDAGPTEAAVVAERIRQKAGALDYSHIREGLSLTLSIGLVCGKPPLVNLIERADRAMYVSKSRGKNSVTIAQVDLVDITPGR